MSKTKENFMEKEPEGYEPEVLSDEDKKRLRFEELQEEAEGRDKDLEDGWVPN